MSAGKVTSHLKRLLWVILFALFQQGVFADVVLSTIHSFQLSPYGAEPLAGLVQGSDGFLYGTTALGGTDGDGGTVFKISTGGVLASMYSFNGFGTNGSSPEGVLVQGSDGYLYGTTESGGTNGNGGTFFKISTNGVLTSLYGFSGYNNSLPLAGVVQGSDGYFYGTTHGGGVNYLGTIFKVSSSGVLTNLHSFSGAADGEYPYGGLVFGTDGYLYGMASASGPNGNGTVFKISTNGAFSVLYSFTGGNDGGVPVSGLVLGSDHNFYGTTLYGGTNDAGTVFKMSSSGVLTNLFSFGGGASGGSPNAGLVQGSDTYFYGTTESGGVDNLGTVFKISSSGAFTTLHSFAGGTDGANPVASLVQANDTYFYGTTQSGGINGGGTVFKISSTGAMTDLYSFNSFNDGANPVGDMIQGSDGYFYGTTYDGATNDVFSTNHLIGTIFKMSANGTLTTLYNNYNDEINGSVFDGRLLQGEDGYIYGTTYNDGAYNFGTIFRMTTNGALAILHTFGSVTNDGANPNNGLIQDAAGNFYGTTQYGGSTNDAGVVFRMSSGGVLTNLYVFTNGPEGSVPQGGLVQGNDGYFYGVTIGGTNGAGTVFKMSSSGALTGIYTFTGGDDGGYPESLIKGKDGNFYGVTLFGGTNSLGTIFKVNTSGALVSIYSFADDNNNPGDTLVQGSDGLLYDTTQFGGGDGVGTVFNISTNGVFTSLYSFTGGNDGGYPHGGLVQGSDGYFYGTTYLGGGDGSGTVFRFTTSPVLQLAIALAGTNVVLTWPTNAAGYTLESTTNLAASVWANLAGQYDVTNPISGPRKFYRLSQ
jgi:uncharacterized repeat protein (TIGR03803 family)